MLFIPAFSLYIALMTASPFIFDTATVRRHIARAMPRFTRHSALFDDTAAQLIERIGEVKRDFTHRLDLSPFPARQENAVSSSALATDGEILPFASESFDLIASNLDLHWGNDVPGILAQIRAILKPEGLFIASLIGEQSLARIA